MRYQRALYLASHLIRHTDDSCSRGGGHCPHPPLHRLFHPVQKDEGTSSEGKPADEGTSIPKFPANILFLFPRLRQLDKQSASSHLTAKDFDLKIYLCRFSKYICVNYQNIFVHRNLHLLQCKHCQRHNGPRV